MKNDLEKYVGKEVKNIRLEQDTICIYFTDNTYIEILYDKIYYDFPIIRDR